MALHEAIGRVGRWGKQGDLDSAQKDRYAQFEKVGYSSDIGCAACVSHFPTLVPALQWAERVEGRGAGELTRELRRSPVDPETLIRRLQGCT